MVEVFKIGKRETLYAVTGKFRTKADALKEVASYKKESITKLKTKYKKVVPGYMIEVKGLINLYDIQPGEKVPNGAKTCVIVRR